MSQTNDAARVRELLFAYAVELRNETPILARYTDCISHPDHLGGYAERERDQAMRRNLMYPDNLTELKMCVDCLTRLRDWRGGWEDVRGALLMNNQPGLAAELKERRERRTADLERMLAAARDLAPMMPTDILQGVVETDAPEQSAVSEYDLLAVLNGKAQPTEEQAAEPPKVRALDFRKWEAAAVKFNEGVADDVAFIKATLAEKIVAAFANIDGELASAGVKVEIRAAGNPALPCGVSMRDTVAVLKWLNDQRGVIPPARFDELNAKDGFELLAVFLAKINDQETLLAEVRATRQAAEDAAQLSRTGNAVAAQGFKTVIANQPQTIEAARQWGVAQHQSAEAKRLNKKQ